MKKQENKNPLFSEMGDEQMKAILKELADTPYWQAILRFNRIKDAQAINSLASADPFKNPTELARTQGVRMGMYYVEQEVLMLIKNSAEEKKAAEEKSKTSTK